MKKTLILLLFFLTGCYNYTELNNLAIVKWASIDFEDDKYTLNYAILNPAKDETVTILEGKGSSISDAISEISLSSSKELYIDHMLVYVISEEIAKDGINKATDYFFRNPNSKKTFQIIISKNCKAKDILKKLSSINNNIIENLANESSLSSFNINTNLLSFIKKIKDPGIEATANGITINKDTIKIEPMAVFKDDKFVKWEDEEISQGITILYNQANISKISTNCGNEKVVFILTDLNVKKSFTIKDKINFKIKITANTEISEMTCNFDLKKMNDLKELENILINSLKNLLNKTITEIKESNIDSIGLGYYIYQNDYQNYLKFKNNYLENLDIEFEIIPNLLAFENNNEGMNKTNE